MQEGWICLHRSIMDHWLWQDVPFSEGQAWIDLLLLANHEDRKTFYKGEIITCDRGTVNRSILSLADRWKWDRKKATRFLHLLEKDGMIELFATKNRTTITIVNYASFQDSRTTKRTTNGTRAGQRVDINNNDNNDNNETIKESKHFVPPSVEEVRSYVIEKGYSVDPESFVAFYASKNWMVGKNKMVDWHACVVTWQKRSNEKKPAKAPANSFNNIMKNQYDFDAIEKMIEGKK